MENNKAMELTQLAAQGDTIDLAIAEAQGKVKVTRLATKKAPRQGVANRNRRAVGAGVEVNGVAVGKGRNGNLNKVGGIGAQMINNPAVARAKFERQVAEDRKAAARERAAERAAEREANALANLDSLLDEIQG